MRKPSGSFHYDFSYGNIGVFVMDIRSQRYNLPPRGRQIFSQAQFDDLRLFLRNNSHKKVLLIVSSVPVVFVPGGWPVPLAGYTSRRVTFLIIGHIPLTFRLATHFSACCMHINRLIPTSVSPSRVGTST